MAQVRHVWWTLGLSSERGGTAVFLKEKESFPFVLAEIKYEYDACVHVCICACVCVCHMNMCVCTFDLNPFSLLPINQ